MRTFGPALLLVLCAATPSLFAAEALEFDLRFTTGTEQYSLASRGEVTYTDYLGRYTAVDMTIVHWIRDANYNPVASSGALHEHAVNYVNYLTATGEIPKCYRSRLAASAGNVGNEVGSSEICFQGPPAPPPPPPETPPPPGGEVQTGCPCTPLVMDISGGKYEFSSAAAGVLYDINADGLSERVAWPIAPSDVGFLFLDRTGNGLPDNGSELFGNATPLRNGKTATNGFAALSEFDSDGDGAIMPADLRWKDLKLWFDRNRDGQADASETVFLGDSGVVWLDVSPTWTGRHDKYGNMFRWKAKFAIEDKKIKQAFYYDVYLTAVH